MYIPIDQVHQLIKCCEYLGVSKDQLIELVRSEHGVNRAVGVSVTEKAFWQRDIVPLANFVQLVQAALLLTNDEYIGLLLGKQLNFMKHGVVGGLAFASPTAAESLLAFVNHSQRANAPFLKIQQCVENNELQVTLTPSELVKDIDRFVVDTALSSCITMIRALMPSKDDVDIAQKVIKHLAVTYAAPQSMKNLERYHDTLVVPIKFKQPKCQIVFYSSVGEKQNPYFSSALVETMEKAIEPLPLDGEGALINTIEQCLAAYDFRFPTLRVVAMQLGLSERTLHRRLSEQGVKYRSICDSLRKTQAKHWIAETMPVEEVAYRLGYFDAASFYKAFKRWEGLSPSDYRTSVNGRHKRS